MIKTHFTERERALKQVKGRGREKDVEREREREHDDVDGVCEREDLESQVGADKP